VATFDLIDGIWVAHPRFAIPIAVVLRPLLIELAASRVSQEGQGTKMEKVYQCLTGPHLRHRVEATVGMYGDPQGIAGRAMQEIASLDNLPIDFIAGKSAD
jgi:hypothetical protein